jgi:hypothetical protein
LATFARRTSTRLPEEVAIRAVRGIAIASPRICNSLQQGWQERAGQ